MWLLFCSFPVLLIRRRSFPSPRHLSPATSSPSSHFLHCPLLSTFATVQERLLLSANRGSCAHACWVGNGSRYCNESGRRRNRSLFGPKPTHGIEGRMCWGSCAHGHPPLLCQLYVCTSPSPLSAPYVHMHSCNENKVLFLVTLNKGLAPKGPNRLQHRPERVRGGGGLGLGPRGPGPSARPEAQGLRSHFPSPFSPYHNHSIATVPPYPYSHLRASTPFCCNQPPSDQRVNTVPIKAGGVSAYRGIIDPVCKSEVLVFLVSTFTTEAMCRSIDTRRIPLWALLRAHSMKY